MSEQIDGNPGSPSSRPPDGTFPSSSRLPSGIVTFLLSDVEGSTRLWEGDEEAMGAAIARHYELLDAAITLHGGVRPVEQGEGDSVVGAFAEPSDAVAAALHAQRTFADEPWPGGQVLRIRIALHTGEAQLRGDDYYVGRTVIRCARLRAVAHGGQTVLSGATRDLVADRLPDNADLRDLGSHRLKDLGAPERVWQLCHPDLAHEFPPLRSLNAFANNLPTQLTSFVGRDAELAELRTVLEANRLVTLTGAGDSTTPNGRCYAACRCSPAASASTPPNTCAPAKWWIATRCSTSSPISWTNPSFKPTSVTRTGAIGCWRRSSSSPGAVWRSQGRRSGSRTGIGITSWRWWSRRSRS
ncbi:adenylate/guanylate cyclase domain-containing protein [Ensifer sp. MPMI2T]|nr:adenylate/guanylate cyclase domain-containing protein [Ensifer sp. MPMI2T]